MPRTGPIVVVGGGIVGTSVAYHLRDVDRPVVVLERSDLLGSGTTRESIAMLGLNYPSPRSFRRYSRDHYHSLVDEGAIEFRRIGALLIRDTDAGIDELTRTAADLAELGHRSRLLEPDEVSEFGVYPPEGSRTLHVPDKGYLDPAEIIAHWIDEAGSVNAEVRTDTPVTDVTVEGGAVTGVETPDGSIATDTVVDAAGPWAPRIAGMAGLSLPLRHNYGPILVLDADEEVSLPFTAFPSKHYFRQEGRTQVFAGRRGASYADAAREDPDAARRIPEPFYLEVEELVSASIPRLADALVVNEWCGVRTITPDDLPLVGETAVAGFYAAAGLSGKGITLAPAVGDALSRLIADGEVDPALRDLALDRFDG